MSQDTPLPCTTKRALLLSFLILSNLILYSGLFAQNIYFVAPNGSPSLSTNQFSPGDIEHAFANATSGSTVYLKNGDYGAVNLIIGHDSVVFEGYQNTPGDLNSSHMPSNINDYYSFNWINIYPTLSILDRAGGGTAIYGQGKSYVTLKNIFVLDATAGINLSGSHNVAENLILSGFGDPYANYDGKGLTHYGNFNQVKNCFVLNAGAEGITIKGDDNLVENSAVFADDSTSHAATDYYIIVTANSSTSQAKRNLVRNCHVERIGNLTHGGHGLCLTTFYIHQSCSSGGGYCYNPIYENDVVEDNVFENCTTSNINEVVLLRGPGVKNNALNDIYSDSFGGLTITAGASNNHFKRCHIKDTYYYDNPTTTGVGFNAAVEFYAHRFGDTLDQNVSYSAQGSYPWEQDIAAQGNTFTNCLFENVSSGVHLSSYSEFVDQNGNALDRTNRKIVKDNVFYNCTFVGRQDTVDCLFYAMRGNQGNKMVNCIITGFHAYYSRYFPESTSQAVQDYHNIIPADFLFDHCGFFNNNFDSNLLSSGIVPGPISPVYEGFSDSVKGEFINCNFSDPGFVDPNNSDFNILDCTGCGSVDHGLSVTDMFNKGYALVDEDIELNDRPCGVNLDLGAYEFQGNCSFDGLSEFKKVFTLYPNPSRGLINLRLENTDFDTYQMLVRDSLGKLVIKPRPVSNEHTTFQLNKAGIYFVEMVNDNESIVKRVVVE